MSPPRNPRSDNSQGGSGAPPSQTPPKRPSGGPDLSKYKGFLSGGTKKGKGSDRVTLQEVVSAATSAGIPKEFIPFFASIIYNESGGHYDPAPNVQGAVGPGQVVGYPTPKSGEDLHAWALGALAASAKHFRGNIDANPGDIKRAIGAYFAGQENVNRYGVDSTSITDKLGTSIKQYVDNVISTSQNISNVWSSSTPAGRSTAKALQAQADAANQALSDARASVAAAVEEAKLTAHVGEGSQWVTVQKKNGNITGLGFSTGVNPPSNVLMANGSPITKGELSTLWRYNYVGIFESYAGRAPTGADVVRTIQAGLSPLGLKAYLSTQPGFMNTPIVKQMLGRVNYVSNQIMGTDAPEALVRKAIGNEWDDTTLAQNMRTYVAKDGSRPYLTGPEFTNNFASMKTTYQKIYGAADSNALQSIKEAAASGWSQDAFANYLRDQPQYKTSVEYQTNAVGLLDSLGLITGGQAILTPGAPHITGTGTAVKDSTLVPGAPKPLNPVLDYTPGVTGGING